MVELVKQVSQATASISVITTVGVFKAKFQDISCETLHGWIPRRIYIKRWRCPYLTWASQLRVALWRQMEILNLDADVVYYFRGNLNHFSKLLLELKSISETHAGLHCADTSAKFGLREFYTLLTLQHR